MLSQLLAEVLNFFDEAFVPTSETILLGTLYSEEIILHVLIRLSVLNPSTYFMMGNFLW